MSREKVPLELLRRWMWSQWSHLGLWCLDDPWPHLSSFPLDSLLNTLMFLIYDNFACIRNLNGVWCRQSGINKNRFVPLANCSSIYYCKKKFHQFVVKAIGFVLRSLPSLYWIYNHYNHYYGLVKVADTRLKDSVCYAIVDMGAGHIFDETWW